MMPNNILRIATRESPLALWQANHVKELLAQYWPSLQIELLPMKTSGDKFLKDKLLKIGGKGLFVKELEEALLSHQADIAVHSMKDVPAIFPDGLCLPVICQRHNPWDAFVSDIYPSLDSLPKGAIVGTSSLRRQAQLLALRPDLMIKPLRGNIHTRIHKMREESYHAIILAVAGLERMGMEHLLKQTLSEKVMLPACGQGALGIECRDNDAEVKKIIAPLNDPLSSLCVRAERQVNALLGGNCHVPLAVLCKPEGEEYLSLHAKVASADGRILLSNTQRGHRTDARIMADNCAQILLADGAAELLNPSVS